MSEGLTSSRLSSSQEELCINIQEIVEEELSIIFTGIQWNNDVMNDPYFGD